MDATMTPVQTTEPNFLRNVILKALLLFILLNLTFSLADPIQQLGQISAYNSIFPGRHRLPFGERPDLAYNLSINNLPAMFASHTIAGTPKTTGEYRVILVGDSSVWGFLLTPSQTLSGLLNKENPKLQDGRSVRVYNLGYPTISLTKDLLMLQFAASYKPDLVIWLTTLEAFPLEKQFSSPIVQNNRPLIQELIETHNLPLNPDDANLERSSFWRKTILGQRRPLADLIRLQLYGVLWSATGIDQYYPSEYEPPQRDLSEDVVFFDMNPPDLQLNELALPVIQAGINLVQPAKVLIINEPIYISDGLNSELRYNFFYPRWAYDQYRLKMLEIAVSQNWMYLDLWDLIPPAEFTNSAIHLSPKGSAMLAQSIAEAIQEIAQMGNLER
jgi:hypothetical protein